MDAIDRTAPKYFDNSYESHVIEEEGNQLRYYSDVANKAKTEEIGSRLITNLSLTNIMRNISSTVIAIINDLTSGNIENVSDFLAVFFREGRTLYIGLILIFIAFSLYLIDLTS